MKNIIYLTTLILFTTTIAFSQIEKVDTSIVVTPINFNPPGTAHYLDLDLDGIDDIVISDYIGSTRVRFIDMSKGDVSGDWGDLNITCNQSTIETCEWENSAWVVHQTSGGGIKGNDAHYFTGNALITLRFKYFNQAGNFYNYKYALLKINKPANFKQYNIEGWYINHTLNEPLSCDLTYNDSIINSYTTVLPVELIYFSAKEDENNNVELNWQTGSEENNKGFEVQHSYDGVNFETIVFVPSKSPNGTTFDYSDYSFIDEYPINGINYYRLKQIDFDGKFDYSQIEAVEINKFIGYNPFFSYLIGLNISPNPTKDFVRLHIAFSTYVDLKVKVVDLNGKVLETVNRYRTNGEKITFDVSNYPSGMYFIQIISDNYSIAKKFVVIK